MSVTILPEGMGVHYDEGEPARKVPPKDVAIGHIKGMWAVVVEGVIVGKTTTQETAVVLADRIKAGSVGLPQTFPKSWGRYASRSE